jgi:hypothetical protein
LKAPGGLNRRHPSYAGQQDGSPGARALPSRVARRKACAII